MVIPTWESLQQHKRLRPLITNSSSSLLAATTTSSHSSFTVQRKPHPKAGPKSVNSLVDFHTLSTFLGSDHMLRHYSDSIIWAQRSNHHLIHQVRVQHTGTDWNDLIINFYPSTSTVLFQGNPTLATRATELLLEFINLKNTSQHSNCAPDATPHNDDDDDNDNDDHRWHARRLDKPPHTTCSSNHLSSSHTCMPSNAHSSSYEEKKNNSYTAAAFFFLTLQAIGASIITTLRPTHANSGVRIGEAANPGPPASSRNQSNDNEYSVKQILDSRFSQQDHHEDGTVQYLIHWSGKDKNGIAYANTWESEHNVTNCGQKLYVFHSNVSNSAKPMGKSLVNIINDFATSKNKTLPLRSLSDNSRRTRSSASASPRKPRHARPSSRVCSRTPHVDNALNAANLAINTVAEPLAPNTSSDISANTAPSAIANLENEPPLHVG